MGGEASAREREFVFLGEEREKFYVVGVDGERIHPIDDVETMDCSGVPEEDIGIGVTRVHGHTAYYHIDRRRSVVYILPNRGD